MNYWMSLSLSIGLIAGTIASPAKNYQALTYTLGAGFAAYAAALAIKELRGSRANADEESARDAAWDDLMAQNKLDLVRFDHQLRGESGVEAHPKALSAMKRAIAKKEEKERQRRQAIERDFAERVGRMLPDWMKSELGFNNRVHIRGSAGKSFSLKYKGCAISTELDSKDIWEVWVGYWGENGEAQCTKLLTKDESTVPDLIIEACQWIDDSLSRVAKR